MLTTYAETRYESLLDKELIPSNVVNEVLKGDNPQKFLRGDHSGLLESKDRSG